MKQLLKIILPQLGKGGLPRYIFLGILSGLCSFLFINCVTRVTGLMISGSFNNISIEYCIAFTLIIVFYIWTRRMLYMAIIRISQATFWKLRKQIISLVLKTDYLNFSAKREQIYAAIVSDVHALTDASTTIIEFFTAVILAVACLAYLSSISLVLFLVTLGIAALGMAVYHFSSRANNRQIEKARNLENNFVADLNDILGGFKEISMEPAKGKYIFDQRISSTARDAYKNNVTALQGLLNNQMTGQVLFYILISSVLLFFSIVLKIQAVDTVSFIFTLLYLLGSIETIMVLLPGLVRAGVASDHLMRLKGELETFPSHDLPGGKPVMKDAFRDIVARNLLFSYNHSEAPFQVGPVDIDISKGEVIFIYGGNGSGKTTFINALIGLCVPTDGEIRFNDQLLDKDNYPHYRALFAVVFADFYLFDELIGVTEIDVQRWNHYLHLFELQDKVKLEGKQFSTTDLSTGQRKRLALIAALMEDKPVLVLDEWAADQDPYFRYKFYTTIIPALKEEGITIIAITHDDKYYHCADKLYKMDEGRLRAEEPDTKQIDLQSV